MTPAADDDETGSAFVSDPDNRRWTYAGPLTFKNAGAVLELARQMALPTRGEVDLTDVEAIDSAAVAVLVALKRRATEEKAALQYVNIPPALIALADLYGVDQLLVN